MYNEKGIEALSEVKSVVESFGMHLSFRKLYGILNAIGMQIEDYEYSIEAVRHLGKALEETAVLYQVDKQGRAKLVEAFETFISKLDKT